MPSKDECLLLARRWLQTEPSSADAALYVLNALKAPGSADAYRAALHEYENLEDRLARELRASPALEVVRLATSIRENLEATPQTRQASHSHTPADVITAPVTEAGETRTASPPDRRFLGSRAAMTPLAAALLLATTSFTSHAGLPGSADREEYRPSVAVVDIRNLSGDSATAWLEVGLPLMVASDITRRSGVGVVSAERVREAREAVGVGRGVPLGRAELMELGVRSGAAWVVSGGVLRGERRYVLDLTVQSTAGGGSPQLFNVSSTSLVALADEAATKLADLARTSVILARNDALPPPK